MANKNKYIIIEDILTSKQFSLFTKGDKVIFEGLYEQYKGYVFSISLRYTRCKDDANDVFQDSFMRIFKHRQTFKPDVSIKKWISRITTNAALDYIKKSYKIELIENAEDDLLFDEETKDTFELSSAIIDEREALQKELIVALNHLPNGARTVFNLFVIDNLTHAEIGEHLGISASSSRSQLVKAKRKLKLLLVHLKKKHEFRRVG